jgi:hypothetical protein
MNIQDFLWEAPRITILLIIAVCLGLAHLEYEYEEWKERKRKKREEAYTNELAHLIASKCKYTFESRAEYQRLQRNGTVARLKKKYNV